MTPPPISPADVIAFWRAAGPKAWFSKSRDFDEAIRVRFESLHHQAARRELDAWMETAEGCLALLLLLDQFPRNLYRGSGHAFATDPLARMVASHGVERGFDRATAFGLRFFCYLPFEHSEALADQDECVRLVQAWIDEGGDPDNIRWVLTHRDIILRFGRFPHRNAALGRTTSAEEQAFLDGGGFSG